MTVFDEHLSSGVVAIMRAASSVDLLNAAEAVLAGGVSLIEVTMTTPGALRVIGQAVTRFGEQVCFGAGTVLDANAARAAIDAGAQFVVAPSVDLGAIETCRERGVPVMPGGFSPTEIVTAWRAGADLVKVFPAGLGGPSLIKALKAPLPHIRMVPVGGVTVANTAEFIRVGAEAVGVGAELVSQRLLDERDFATITARAAQFREQVALGRTGGPGSRPLEGDGEAR